MNYCQYICEPSFNRKMINSCKECGCTCKNCGKLDNDIHLHVEIETLKQKLLERDNHIIRMETNFLNESSVDSDEVMLLKDELQTWQDKYKRLFDAHKRVQRVNQGLEDKLLKLVDVSETDKNALTRDVAVLSEKLAEANYSVKKLTESNERYKNDVNVAIQFLQCKQSNFVAHKFDTLPPEIQNEVSSFMTHKKKPEERRMVEPKSIKVPIPTFPPTAMFYSVPKSPNAERINEHEPIPSSPQVDVVSAAIMAKVLEERQRERMCVKHCDTCTCSKNLKLTDPNRYHDIGIQTEETAQYCKTCTDLSQTNFQIPKLPRSTDIANTKVPNFELENYNNIVKVQPNNFLVEKSSSNASSLLDLDMNLNSDLSNISLDSIKVNIINENVTDSIKLKDQSLVTSTNTRQNKMSEVSQYQVLPIGKAVVSQVFNNESNGDSNLNNRSRSSVIYTPSISHSSVEKKIQNINTPSAKFNVVHAHKNIGHDIINVEPSYSVRKSSGDDLKLSKTVINERVQSEGTRLESINQNFESLDRSKYHEMEENVKRFLFKKTELWKEQSESYLNETQQNSEIQQTFSHTQTEI